jgi:hypothetical protein
MTIVVWEYGFLSLSNIVITCTNFVHSKSSCINLVQVCLGSTVYLPMQCQLQFHVLQQGTNGNRWTDAHKWSECDELQQYGRKCCDLQWWWFLLVLNQRDGRTQTTIWLAVLSPPTERLCWTQMSQSAMSPQSAALVCQRKIHTIFACHGVLVFVNCWTLLVVKLKRHDLAYPKTVLFCQRLHLYLLYYEWWILPLFTRYLKLVNTMKEWGTVQWQSWTQWKWHMAIGLEFGSMTSILPLSTMWCGNLQQAC